MNAREFYFWTFMKDLIYKWKSSGLFNLKGSITDSFSSLKQEMLGFVTGKFVIKLRYFIINEKKICLLSKILSINFVLRFLFNSKMFVVFESFRSYFI